jgi:hypothetical protein
MNTGNFTFEVLVTFVLPGFLVAIGLLLLHGVDKAQLEFLLESAGKAQFLSVFFILAIVILCGAVIASVHAVIETNLLDSLTAWRVGQSKAEFDAMWMNYVAALADYKNPYISRVVLFFQFESRLGLALLFLGTLLLCADRTHGLILVPVGLVIYGIALMHHKELAQHRIKLCTPQQSNKLSRTAKKK